MPSTTLLEIPPEEQVQMCGTPPHPVWLSAGVPYITAVCCGP